MSGTGGEGALRGTKRAASATPERSPCREKRSREGEPEGSGAGGSAPRWLSLDDVLNPPQQQQQAGQNGDDTARTQPAQPFVRGPDPEVDIGTGELRDMLDYFTSQGYDRANPERPGELLYEEGFLNMRNQALGAGHNPALPPTVSAAAEQLVGQDLGEAVQGGFPTSQANMAAAAAAAPLPGSLETMLPPLDDDEMFDLEFGDLVDLGSPATPA
jgi:hypothetical protein